MTTSWLIFISFAATPPREVVDRIAAVIESEIITVRELERKAAPFMDKLQEISDLTEREKRRREILQQVLDIEIGERIVNAEIERNKDRLGVTDQDIDRTVQDVMHHNRLTREQLEAALYGQGLTWSEFRDKLRSQLQRKRLIEFLVQAKVQLKDSDIKRRCEERQHGTQREVRVCASHVLRKIPAKAGAEEVEKLRARMSQMQAELAAGADFAAYALKYSDDTAAPNGDLGCFGRGEMLREFEEMAYRLEVGDVSQVIRTEFGFHIIKVTDRQQASGADCSDEAVLNNFRNEIYQEEMDRQMNAWLADLRRKAFVEVRL
ncbi:MAG: peptidylprolyl isomerase [Deltaproteobacteria bacterium]|nr:peptidylprolyl isomerase [Deltaproteobacteria bacterium]